MREKYRKSIASLNKFSQFTTMNVIDGQAGLISYTSLIFYSLTIDNILNIIVLLILAGVTIATLTGENGILTMANETKMATEIADVKERVQTDILGVQADNKSGGITKVQFVEILNNYFDDVPTAKEFPEDLATLTLTTKAEYGSHNIKISEIYNGSFPKTVESLNAGDKVYYDTGKVEIGNKGIIECKVLYDSSSSYGIQIISSDVIKTTDGTVVAVPLGYKDQITGSSNFEKARNSYNNALKKLYEEAQKYLNLTYAREARCVGSDPANPDWDTTTNDAGYFTKTEDEDDYYAYMKNYYGTLKNGDTKYITDWTQMETIKAQGRGTAYWLASRYISSTSNTTSFYVSNDLGYGQLDRSNHQVWQMYSYGGSGYSSLTYIRFPPCVYSKLWNQNDKRRWRYYTIYIRTIGEEAMCF